MISRNRSIAIKKAWKHRKPEHHCFYCKEPIWVGGIKEDGKWYHRSCANRKEIIEARHEHAKRGYYKKHKR